jgi:hypothetical protein
MRETASSQNLKYHRIFVLHDPSSLFSQASKIKSLSLLDLHILFPLLSDATSTKPIRSWYHSKCPLRAWKHLWQRWESSSKPDPINWRKYRAFHNAQSFQIIQFLVIFYKFFSGLRYIFTLYIYIYKIKNVYLINIQILFTYKYL